MSSPLSGRVSRPAPSASWNADWHDGPHGSAMHHDRLSVRASYAATRPDEHGRPNRIDVGITAGESREVSLPPLDRKGAELLRDALFEALSWDGESDVQ